MPLPSGYRYCIYSYADSHLSHQSYICLCPQTRRAETNYLMPMFTYTYIHLYNEHRVRLEIWFSSPDVCLYK